PQYTAQHRKRAAFFQRQERRATSGPHHGRCPEQSKQEEQDGKQASQAPPETQPLQDPQNPQRQAENRPAPVPAAYQHQAGQQMKQQREQIQDGFHEHSVLSLPFFQYTAPASGGGELQQMTLLLLQITFEPR